MKNTLKAAVFSVATFVCTNPVFAHGISEGDRQAMLDGGYLRYLTLGASHMVTGYDHLLFLFGVIFFLTKFTDIVKFITAFTLGHSITLIFATFMQITANYYLVDAVIALTVFYKGFDNVDGFKKYLGIESPNLLKLVFAFGLIHGFGLSTRLQQLPLGEDGLLMRIISFNIGVELGQIGALTVMLLLLFSWRQSESFKKFSNAANCGIMAAGILLFLLQMHGYSHAIYADELAFSHDAHVHAHSEMFERQEPIGEENEELHSHDGGPMHRDEEEYEEEVHSLEDEELHSHEDGEEHRHIEEIEEELEEEVHSHEDGEPHSH